jgi:DNA invertase Pin-like site-specific DNA recombinase
MLWECIDDIKSGRAQVLVAYSYDRLSREPQMQAVALYEIENKYGGRFEAITEKVDQANPFSDMIRNILGTASSVERRRIVERMQRGKRMRYERGSLYGAANPKYGYR